jgi:hypothetical protein
MTTDNSNDNGVEPTPEISDMVSDLIDNANAMSLSDDNVPDEPDEPEILCSSCGNEVEDDGTLLRGRLYGDWHRYYRHDRGFTGDRTRVPDDELVFCEDCYSSCEDCSEFTVNHALHSVYVHGCYHHVCESCNESYAECPRCARMFHTDEMTFLDYFDSDRYGDMYVCDECYGEVISEGRNVVRDYSWQPSPRNFWVVKDYDHTSSRIIRFRGATALLDVDGWNGYPCPYPEIEENKNQLFMGFELETNNRDCSNLGDAGEFLLRAVAGCDDHEEGEKYLYLKNDGSISGFEIVSMPATLEAHKLLLPKEGIRGLVDYGLSGWRSVDGNGAGLHIHVSKNAFSHSHLHKFQMFHYRNSEWLKKFAGRDSGRWASFERTSSSYGNDYKLSDFSKGTYNHRELNRYHALNFVPHNTVELRYFRSTLNPESLLGTLELVHAMWRYTLINKSRDIHDDKFNYGTFRAWVASQSTYEYLIPTMERRSI